MVVVFQEIAHQLRNIRGTLAQWRHVQIHDIDAVEKVGTECAVGDFFFELAIGGADYAHFNFLVFLGADAAELAVLQ